VGSRDRLARAVTSPDWARASADEIRAHLHEIDVDAFERAAANDAFTDEHVRLLLKDPGLPSDLVERISREPRFFQKNIIRVALAMHPKLPRVRGLELVRWLYWRDLLRVTVQPSVHPQVRVTADQLLAEKIPDLTLGERISLARSASRAVLRALRLDPDPRVIEAILRNARCTEEDVVFMAASTDSHPLALSAIARSARWRARPYVREQLVRNRRLALPVALGLMTELGRGELAVIARQAELPKLLREAAQRKLSETSKRRVTR
jgi:hypothetical protein